MGDGKYRILAIRDHVVEGVFKLILEPVIKADLPIRVMPVKNERHVSVELGGTSNCSGQDASV